MSACLALVRVPALFAIPLLLASCAAGWGVGAGLSVDTDGEVGAVASARMSFGLAFDDQSGIVESVYVDAGGAANVQAGDLGPGVGLDYVRQPATGPLAWRLGFRGRFDLRFAGEGNTYDLGAGGATALLAVLDESGDTYTNLGGELQGYFLQPIDDRSRASKGLFILSVVWEQWAITELGDMFGGR